MSEYDINKELADIAKELRVANMIKIAEYYTTHAPELTPIKLLNALRQEYLL